MSNGPPALRADQAVARIFAESESAEALYPQVLAAIGDSLGWELGAIWELPHGADALTCLEVWCSDDAWEGAHEFADVTRSAHSPTPSMLYWPVTGACGGGRPGFPLFLLGLRLRVFFSLWEIYSVRNRLSFVLSVLAAFAIGLPTLIYAQQGGVLPFHLAGEAEE